MPGKEKLMIDLQNGPNLKTKHKDPLNVTSILPISNIKLNKSIKKDAPINLRRKNIKIHTSEHK